MGADNFFLLAERLKTLRTSLFFMSRSRERRFGALRADFPGASVYSTYIDCLAPIPPQYSQFR